MNFLENIRLFKFWDQLRSSYWFVPSLLVIGAMLLAFGLVSADLHYRFQRGSGPSWLFLGQSESARSILSTIATAMITIVSLTFSMTIVVLTLASSQFGPRLLYNFMRDRSNQLALGVFVACFVYCLLVLRTVQASAPDAFVPHLGTTGAMAFAVLSVGVLIHFIHHVAESIQANTVIANVRHELESIVERVLPAFEGDRKADESEWQRLQSLLASGAAPISTEARGIVQAVDQDALVSWAKTHDVMVRLRHRPGEFVIRGNIVCDVFPRDRAPHDDIAPLHEALSFGHHRTLVQDIEFAFQQLVEIAVRALSPGINDPFTAMSCVEELASGLALVSERSAQPRILRDEEGVPRVLVKAVNFEGVCDIAFNQIRQNGAAHPAVMIRQLEAIIALAPTVNDIDARAVLLRHAKAIHGAAVGEAHDSGDRADIDARFDEAASLLGGTTVANSR